MVTTARRLYEFLCSRVRKDSRRQLISRVEPCNRGMMTSEFLCISVRNKCCSPVAICVDHCVTARSCARGSLYGGQAERFDIARIFVTFPFPLVIRAVAVHARTRRAKRAYASLHCTIHIRRKYCSKNCICLTCLAYMLTLLRYFY